MKLDKFQIGMVCFALASIPLMISYELGAEVTKYCQAHTGWTMNLGACTANAYYVPDYIQFTLLGSMFLFLGAGFYLFYQYMQEEAKKEEAMKHEAENIDNKNRLVGDNSL